jgi:hypothetical protein
MGEIDEADDPVDHRVAEGHERHQGAVGQADQALLDEELHDRRGFP